MDPNLINPSLTDQNKNPKLHLNRLIITLLKIRYKITLQDPISFLKEHP